MGIFRRPCRAHRAKPSNSRSSSSRSPRRSLPFWETLELRTLFDAASFALTGVDSLRADSNFAGIDGKGVGVAILDTGMFASHPDLVGNFTRFFDAVKNGQNAATDPGPTNPAA